MNWDRIEGNWKQLKGKVKEQWGRLTDDDFDVIAGRQDQLVGRIQERYGLKRADAEREVERFERGVEGYFGADTGQREYQTGSGDQQGSAMGDAGDLEGDPKTDAP